MVYSFRVRYVNNELFNFFTFLQVIVARQQKEAVEKKMKEMEKEREQLLSKNKMLIGERARICQTLDTKVNILRMKCVYMNRLICVYIFICPSLRSVCN